MGDEQPEDVAWLKKIMDECHSNFIDLVKRQRANKLTNVISHEKLFSGDVFTAQQSVESGLIDGIGDLHTEMEKRFGENVKLIHVKSEAEKILGILGITTTSIIGSIISTVYKIIKQQSIWLRYG